jgi:WD40 repeat protein
MNEKELRKLLKQLEGAKLEFKSQMYQLEGQGRKTQWTELIKDIIALANGNLGTANEVGYLIIGASDQLGEDGIREIYDVGEVNLTQKQLLDKIGSFCITPLQDLNVETIPIDGKRIFIITIPPSDYLHELEKPLQTKTWEFSEGSVLLRRIDGEKIYKANDEERSRIRKEKQNRHRQQNSLYSKLTSYQHIKSEIEAGRFSELLETYSDALKPSLDDISEAERENLILVQATLRISEKIIKSDVNQLSSQLIGRLLSSQEPDIQKVLKEAEENQEEQERYWLKPLSASLQAPIASLRYSFKEGKQSIQAVAVDYRSDKLIAGFADGTLKIWHLNSGKSIKTWQGHNQQINHLTVTPDNTKIISISEDWILKIWNIIDCNLIYSSEVFQSEINSISVTSDSKKVVLAFEDAGIQVLSIPTRKFVTPAEIVNYPFEDALNNLVSTKDGKYIIFSEDTKIYMWEQDDNNIYLLGSHDGKVRDLILFSHHNFLLSISDDDSLKIWDLDHKMCQSVREGIFVRNVTITPDEESIIFSTDKGNQFQIWHWKRDKLDFF